MSPGDAYERIEQAARAEGPRFVPLRQRLIEIIILILAIFLLGYLLYAAQFSGGVRWFLGCSLITILGLYAWYTVSRTTSEPAPLAEKQRAPRARYGDLASFTSVVRRANQGLPYSQVAVSSRAREAFEERVRLARGLSPEAMHDLEGDPVGLQSAFRDPALVDFVLLSSTEPDERYRWVWAQRAAEGFEVGLHRILSRMEAWR